MTTWVKIIFLKIVFSSTFSTGYFDARFVDITT